MQACTQAFAGMLSDKSQVQSALLNQSNQTVIDKNLDTVQHQMVVSSPVSAYGAGISIPTYYDKMFNIVDFILILIIVL